MAALTAEDALKLLVFLLAGAGLLVLGRWSGRLGAGQPPDSPADAPTPDAEQLQPQAATPPVWPPSAEEVAASLPPDPALGKLRIKKFFFQKTDVAPGPAEPDVFADELHIQLYDPDNNYKWWQSYFVATPKGLAEKLKDKSWRYLFAPQILVFPRYDLEEIRRAVVARIMADHDYFKDKENVEEESL